MNSEKSLDQKTFLKQIIHRAVKIYNRYRRPEAEAQILRVSEDKVVVEFRGSFCRTCGIRDWVEDFKYVLEDLGVENELIEYIEPVEINKDYRIGVFKIKGYRGVITGEVGEHSGDVNG